MSTRSGAVLARVKRASMRAPWCRICATFTSHAGPSASFALDRGQPLERRAEGDVQDRRPLARREFGDERAANRLAPSARPRCASVAAAPFRRRLSVGLNQPASYASPERSAVSAANAVSHTSQSTARSPGKEHATAKSASTIAASQSTRRSRKTQADGRGPREQPGRRDDERHRRQGFGERTAQAAQRHRKTPTTSSNTDRGHERRRDQPRAIRRRRPPPRAKFPPWRAPRLPRVTLPRRLPRRPWPIAWPCRSFPR